MTPAPLAVSGNAGQRVRVVFLLLVILAVIAVALDGPFDAAGRSCADEAAAAEAPGGWDRNASLRVNLLGFTTIGSGAYPTGRLKTTTSPTRDADQFQMRSWTDDGVAPLDHLEVVDAGQLGRARVSASMRSVEAANPDVSDPARRRVVSERYEYDGVGRQVRTTDAVPYAAETAWTGDGLARTVTSRRPGGPVDHQQSFAYDENGQLTETSTLIESGRSDTTRSGWFADGLQYEQTSPAPNRYVNRWSL